MPTILIIFFNDIYFKNFAVPNWVALEVDVTFHR